jgi:hypothetical protein
MIVFASEPSFFLRMIISFNPETECRAPTTTLLAQLPGVPAVLSYYTSCIGTDIIGDSFKKAHDSLIQLSTGLNPLMAPGVCAGYPNGEPNLLNLKSTLNA